MPQTTHERLAELQARGCIGLHAKGAPQGAPPARPEHVATPQGRDLGRTPRSLPMILAGIPDPETRRYIAAADPRSGKSNIYGQLAWAMALMFDDVLARLGAQAHGVQVAPHAAFPVITDEEAGAIRNMLAASLSGLDMTQGRLVQHVLLSIRELMVRVRDQRAILHAARVTFAAAYAGDTASIAQLDATAASQALTRLVEARAQLDAKIDELERATPPADG